MPYVRVDDVDATVTRACSLGATMAWEPFDVPGVGRNAVLRDPTGALVCPHMPTHTFPAPSGVFVGDILLTDDVPSVQAFYWELFGWDLEPRSDAAAAGNGVARA